MSRVLTKIKFGGGFDGKDGDLVEERGKGPGKNYSGLVRKDGPHEF